MATYQPRPLTPGEYDRFSPNPSCRSRRALQVEAVAAVIAEAEWAYDFASALAYATHINSGDGWALDLHHGGEGPGNWTHADGVVLSPGELAEAVALSENMDAPLTPKQRSAIPFAN